MNSSTTPNSATMQEYVAEELRNAILRGEFIAGAPVRQELLTERLNVSIAPVREALRILQAEGTLTYRPRRGYIVSQLATDEIDEIFAIRDLLETKMLRDAKPDAATIKAMTEAHERFAKAVEEHDILAMSHTTRAMSFSLFGSAKQPRTLAIVESLWERTNPYRAAYWQDQQVLEETSRTQELTIDLARAGDTNALVETYQKYRHATRTHLRKIIQESAQK